MITLRDGSKLNPVYCDNTDLLRRAVIEIDNELTLKCFANRELLGKLHRRNRQIKELKKTIENKTKDIEKIYDIINNISIDSDETISQINQIVSDN